MEVKKGLEGKRNCICPMQGAGTSIKELVAVMSDESSKWPACPDAPTLDNGPSQLHG